MKEGQVLKQARERKGLTQAEVAVALKFETPQFVSNIERNKASLPKTSFKRLAKVLGPKVVHDIIRCKVRAYEQELRA